MEWDKEPTLSLEQAWDHLHRNSKHSLEVTDRSAWPWGRTLKKEARTAPFIALHKAKVILFSTAFNTKKSCIQETPQSQVNCDLWLLF